MKQGVFLMRLSGLSLIGFVFSTIASLPALADPACVATIGGWYGNATSGNDRVLIERYTAAFCPSNPSAAALDCIHAAVGVNNPANPNLIKELCTISPTQGAAQCFNAFRQRTFLPRLGFASEPIGDETAFDLCSKNTSNDARDCVLELLRDRQPRSASVALCAKDYSTDARACFNDLRAHGARSGAAAQICSAPLKNTARACFASLAGPEHNIDQGAAAALCSRNPSTTARDCLVALQNAGFNVFFGIEYCARTGSTGDVGGFIDMLNRTPSGACVSARPYPGQWPGSGPIPPAGLPTPPATPATK